MIEKSAAEIFDPLRIAEVTIFEANEKVLEKELKKAAATAAKQEEIAGAGDGGLVEKLKKTRKKSEAPTAKPVVETPAAAEPTRQVEHAEAAAGDGGDTISMLFGGRRP